MKLLLASAEFPPFRGGVAEVAAGFARCVSGIGWNTAVLTHRKKGLDPVEIPGVSLVRYPFVSERFPRFHILVAALRLVRTIPFFDACVAIDFITQRALSLLPAPFLTAYNFWLFVHGSDVMQHAMVGRLRRRKALFKTCNGVMANSRYTLGLVQQFFPGSNSHLLYPGIREEFFTDARNETRILEIRRVLSGRMLLLCVGRLDPRKGQDTLIRSLPYLRDMGHRVLVAFIGSGPYRGQLENMVRETESASDVLFLGAVGDKEKMAWLDAADLVVQPSRREGLMVEGLGLAMAEAGARRRPVLSSRHGGIPEVVIDGCTGVLVPEDAPAEAWAREASRLLENGGRRRRLGEAAREYVASTFRWSSACSRFKDLLTNLGEKGE